MVPKEPTDIPAAVKAAKDADLIILAVGGRSSWSGERTEGEGSDTANVDLQLTLASATLLFYRAQPYARASFARCFALMTSIIPITLEPTGLMPQNARTFFSRLFRLCARK